MNTDCRYYFMHPDNALFLVNEVAARQSVPCSRKAFAVALGKCRELVGREIYLSPPDINRCYPEPRRHHGRTSARTLISRVQIDHLTVAVSVIENFPYWIQQATVIFKIRLYHYLSKVGVLRRWIISPQISRPLHLA